MVGQGHNFSTTETEAGLQHVQDWPEIYSEFEASRAYIKTVSTNNKMCQKKHRKRKRKISWVLQRMQIP